MPSSPHLAELPLDAPPQRAADPEFDELPAPRRPGKRVTIGVMVFTAVVALLLAYSLRGEVAYAIHTGQPVEVGGLTHFRPHAAQANTWVHAEGRLDSTGAIRYSRLLEQDTFRLAPVAGNQRIWVEIRVPAGGKAAPFVPPSSFVGRLIPLYQAGLRHQLLPGSDFGIDQDQLAPANAWLLIDGEAPASTRWAFGLVGVLLAFAAFNIWGLVRLLRPVGA